MRTVPNISQQHSRTIAVLFLLARKPLRPKNIVLYTECALYFAIQIVFNTFFVLTSVHQITLKLREKTR